METHIQALLADSKIEYYNKIPAISIKASLNGNIPEIGTIAKHSHNAAIEIICHGLSMLLGFLGLNKIMSPEQIVKTAEFLLEDYPDIPIDALKLFFRNVAKGRYGEMYGSIDGQKILVWFSQFYNEYLNTLIDEKMNEHEQTKKW